MTEVCMTVTEPSDLFHLWPTRQVSRSSRVCTRGEGLGTSMSVSWYSRASSGAGTAVSCLMLVCALEGGITTILGEVGGGPDNVRLQLKSCSLYLTDSVLVNLHNWVIFPILHMREWRVLQGKLTSLS